MYVYIYTYAYIYISLCVCFLFPLNNINYGHTSLKTGCVYSFIFVGANYSRQLAHTLRF